VSNEVWIELVTQMRELAQTMSDELPNGLHTTRVTQFAAAAVPGAEHAAISLIKKSGLPKTIVSTSDVPLKVDQLQYDTGEGPAMQVLRQSDLVWSDDLSNDTQWPDFGPRAVQITGIRSIVSYRLFLTSERRAALNLYASAPGAFDELALSIGTLFAAYASLTLLNDLHRDKVMNLERALESNREIGCAIGILMARELCTQDQALQRLTMASQHTQRKLADIAETVKQTGRLPLQPKRH